VQEQTGCVEGGNHCGRKGEPESTDGTEYNAGESVAEYELKDTRDKQQKATKEDDRPGECNPIPTSSSPGHQAT